MHVTIRFFATLRDRAGVDSITLDLQGNNTIGDLARLLAEMHPSIAPSLPSALFAINYVYAQPGELLHDGDQVGIFPPVSGGARVEPQPEYLEITDAQIDLNKIVTSITRPDTGGVCCFTGTVRGLTTDQSGIRETYFLEYEAYTEMAELTLKQVASEIRSRFPRVIGIAIVQRVGRLHIGECTVAVACSAGHRDEGIFEAAHYGIDRLKEIVPIWKKEAGPGGSMWIEGHYRPGPSDMPHQSEE